MGRSFTILRIAGIPLGIQPLWLVIVVLITWSLGDSYYPDAIHGIAPVAAYGLGFASALLLFVSIVAHEYGHALTARRHGMAVEGIDLWLLGGVAKMRGQPRRPADELRFAAAGPLVTLVIVAIFAALALLLPSATPKTVAALVDYQLYVNGVILGFNLLPAFPLDGGRIVRALIWMFTGDLRRATRAAARAGRLFGWFFVAFGFFDAMGGIAGGLWLALIGFFIVAASNAEARQAELEQTFAGIHARDLMTAPAISLAAETTLRDAVELFQRYRFASFPVTEGDRVIGLLTLAAVEALPPAVRETMRVGELADRDPALLVGLDEDVVAILGSAAFGRDGRAAVVDADDHLAGLISITDVTRALRARSLGT